MSDRQRPKQITRSNRIEDLRTYDPDRKKPIRMTHIETLNSLGITISAKTIARVKRARDANRSVDRKKKQRRKRVRASRRKNR